MYMMRFYQIIVHHIAMLHIALVYACGHVYRHAAQSERPALHSPVRILSCGKESHETDLGQPHGLAAELVEGFRMLLRGGTVAENLPESFEVVRACPHGYGGRHWRRFCLTTIRQQ